MRGSETRHTSTTARAGAPRSSTISTEGALVIAAAVLGALGSAGGLIGPWGPVGVVAILAVTATAVHRRPLDLGERAFVASGLALGLGWTVAALLWGTGVSGARGLGLGVTGFGAALLVARRATADQALAAVRVLMIGALSLSAVSLVAYTLRAPTWTVDARGVWRAAGPVGYPNAFGLLLVLLVPLLTPRRPGVSAALQRAALLVLTAAATVTMSRGALLAAGVCIAFLPQPSRRRLAAPAALGVVLAMPLLAHASSSSTSWWTLAPLAVGAISVAVTMRPRACTLAMVGLVLCAVVGVAGIDLVDDVAAVGSQRLTPANIDTRSPEWGAGLDQFLDAPVIGTGPEQALVVTDPRHGHLYWSRFVHSEFLQIAAGAGVLGIGLLTWFTLRLARVLRGSGAPHTTATALALAAGGLVDFSWHFPALTVIAGLLLGLNPRTESE